MGQGDPIQFVSSLGRRYHADLEKLLFFNPQQGRARGGIVASVERFGSPEIAVEGEALRITTTQRLEVQTLYAVVPGPSDQELVGAILFLRERHEHVTVLHLAVRLDHSATGRFADRWLALRLMAEVQAVAARIKGVAAVRFFRANGAVAEIAVRRRR